MSNLGGAPLLAPSLAPTTAKSSGVSSLPIAPAAAFNSPVPEKTLASGITVPSTLPKTPGVPGSDGTILRAPTAAEAAQIKPITPAETIANAEKAQEDLASQAQEYDLTGKGPVPLKGQENYAPGQNLYLPGGGTVRIPTGGLSGVTKAAVEFPERLFNDVKDAVSAVQGNGFDTKERVPSFENDANNVYNAAKAEGFSDNQATIVAMLQGVGSGIIDSTVVQGLFGSGTDALIKATAQDADQIAAWKLLDSPSTPEELKSNYRSLSHEFHPDKPGGSEAVQAKINDAYNLLQEKGIPSDIKARINGILSKVDPKAAANAEDILNKARESAKGPTLNLPAAGETSVEAPKTELPVIPAAPVETPPVALPPAPEPVAASSPLSKVTSPTVDLSAPKNPITDIVPPKPGMTDTVLSKLSTPKINPVQDIAPPSSSFAPPAAPKITPEKTVDLTPKPIEEPAIAPKAAKSGVASAKAPAAAPVATPAAAGETITTPKTDIAPKSSTLPAEEKPFSPETKTSGIARSIEQKAKDAGLTKGFEKKAQFETINHADQAQRAKDLISSGIDNARAVVRGEAELPDGLKGTALINEMENYMKIHPSGEMAEELANSPLVTAGSEAAQEMGLMAEREPDSAMSKIQELKRNLVKRAGGSQKVAAARTKIVRELKEATTKVNLSKEDLSWDKFLKSIEC